MSEHFNNNQGGYFKKMKCLFCHKEPIKYSIYKTHSAYICDKKECNQKWEVKIGFFKVTIAI